MSIQPKTSSADLRSVQSSNTIGVQNKGMIPLRNARIDFTKPNLNPLDKVHNPIDSFHPLAKRSKGIETVVELPLQFRIEILDFLKATSAAIDKDVPKTLEIITPKRMVNYYEDYYGDVSIDYLDPNQLILSIPRGSDKPILPIELGRITTLDFIGFDEGMAFIVTNGTNPENVVLAENMSADSIGYSVLLSLNDNSQQNVELIQSTNSQVTPFSIDIPLGLTHLQVGQMITDISDKTETIQIVSPDFVTETSHDDQTIFELGIISGFVNLFIGEKKSYLSDRFGSLSTEEIIIMLENPVSVKDQISSIPITDAFTSGTFLIGMHGKMMSYTLVDVDCKGIDQLSFIGRNGLVLSTSRERLNDFGGKKASVSIYPTRQTAVGETCRVPELKFNPNINGGNDGPFGLFHINDEGHVSVVLTNHDLIQIFGKDDASLSMIINLVKIMSGGSDHVNLDIAACMLVHPKNRKDDLITFRISNKQQDIPHFFNYEPQILVAREVDRVKTLAPDRFCRVGADDDDADARDLCEDHLLEETLKLQRSIDPNLGLSGAGIREALHNKELITDVYAVFLDKQRIRGDHFNLLLKWYQQDLMRELFEELHKIGIHQNISLSHIIPELNEVFSSFRPNDSFTNFLNSLKKILKGKKRAVNLRL